MDSAGNQNNLWAPYNTYKDCSQGICSIYCPQWCYRIFPPPPPFTLGEDDDDSDTDFSPLIIAIIGILASAFILVSYYTIISKYCRRRRGNSADNVELNENHDGVASEAWQGTSGGLDEALIKSITVCKYKKNDGFIEGTDCSVCLSEFQENESLRLLPRCSHAFHLPCIDMWLKSHASCPLCRAHIAPANILPVQTPPPVVETTMRSNLSAMEYHQRIDDTVLVIEEPEAISVCEEAVVVVGENTPLKLPAVSIQDSMKNMEENNNRDEGGDDDDEMTIQPMRRSASLNSSLCQIGRVSIADILRISEEEDEQYYYQDTDYKHRGTRILNFAKNPLAMRRSISTGRFMYDQNNWT